MKLDTFVAAYLEMALHASVGEDDRPLDDDFSIDDLSEEVIGDAIADCADFRDANAEDLERAGGDDERNGQDFWLTRNGHGTGFWDRGLGEVGDRLARASKIYGGVDLVVGGDGKIH